MDASLVVACISGVFALTSVIFTGWTQLRLARRDREILIADRRSEAKVALDRFRGPLLDAAWQLGDRVHNIRNRGLLGYMSGGRADDVKMTTLFRLAYYMAWREILRTQVQLLRFERAEDTKLVSTFLNDVTWVLASDRVDSTWPLWSDEQRAIGELMIVQSSATSPTVRGAASFRSEYEKTFAPWMERFAADLLSNAATASVRLKLLQWSLYGLTRRLDEEDVYGGGWITRSVTEIQQPTTTTARRRHEEQLREHLAAIIALPPGKTA